MLFRSSWLEHALDKRRVIGSSPIRPTTPPRFEFFRYESSIDSNGIKSYLLFSRWAGFFEIRTLGKKIQLPINKAESACLCSFYTGRKEKFQYIKKDKKLLRAHDECLGANRR